MLIAPLISRTLPRVRELKHNLDDDRSHNTRRTLPRVRELKRDNRNLNANGGNGRTLPRVRELKLMLVSFYPNIVRVAPFPGCVN